MSEAAALSVRVVTVDTSVEAPNTVLGGYREQTARKVPILRIFGSTPSGGRVCVNLHGAFPYIYIPYPAAQEAQTLHSWARRFVSDLELQLHQARFGAAARRYPSSPPEVHSVVLVHGKDFYGAHLQESYFLRVSFYSPYVVSKASDILRKGMILGTRFQPFEAHFPFHMQVFCDYNIYGMEFVHFRRVQQLAAPMVPGDPPPTRCNQTEPPTGPTLALCSAWPGLPTVFEAHVCDILNASALTQFQRPLEQAEPHDTFVPSLLPFRQSQSQETGGKVTTSAADTATSARNTRSTDKDNTISSSGSEPGPSQTQSTTMDKDPYQSQEEVHLSVTPTPRDPALMDIDSPLEATSTPSKAGDSPMGDALHLALARQPGDPFKSFGRDLWKRRLQELVTLARRLCTELHLSLRRPGSTAPQSVVSAAPLRMAANDKPPHHATVGGGGDGARLTPFRACSVPVARASCTLLLPSLIDPGPLTAHTPVVAQNAVVVAPHQRPTPGQQLPHIVTAGRGGDGSGVTIPVHGPSIQSNNSEFGSALQYTDTVSLLDATEPAAVSDGDDDDALLRILEWMVGNGEEGDHSPPHHARTPQAPGTVIRNTARQAIGSPWYQDPTLWEEFWAGTGLSQEAQSAAEPPATGAQLALTSPPLRMAGPSVDVKVGPNTDEPATQTPVQHAEFQHPISLLSIPFPPLEPTADQDGAAAAPHPHAHAPESVSGTPWTPSQPEDVHRRQQGDGRSRVGEQVTRDGRGKSGEMTSDATANRHFNQTTPLLSTDLPERCWTDPRSRHSGDHRAQRGGAVSAPPIRRARIFRRLRREQLESIDILNSQAELESPQLQLRTDADVGSASEHHGASQTSRRFTRGDGYHPGEPSRESDANTQGSPDEDEVLSATPEPDLNATNITSPDSSNGASAQAVSTPVMTEHGSGNSKIRVGEIRPMPSSVPTDPSGTRASGLGAVASPNRHQALLRRHRRAILSPEEIRLARQRRAANRVRSPEKRATLSQYGNTVPTPSDMDTEMAPPPRPSSRSRPRPASAVSMHHRSTQRRRTAASPMDGQSTHALRSSKLSLTHSRAKRRLAVNVTHSTPDERDVAAGGGSAVVQHRSGLLAASQSQRSCSTPQTITIRTTPQPHRRLSQTTPSSAQEPPVDMTGDCTSGSESPVPLLSEFGSAPSSTTHSQRHSWRLRSNPPPASKAMQDFGLVAGSTVFASMPATYSRARDALESHTVRKETGAPKSYFRCPAARLVRGSLTNLSAFDPPLRTPRPTHTIVPSTSGEVVDPVMRPGVVLVPLAIPPLPEAVQAWLIRHPPRTGIDVRGSASDARQQPRPDGRKGTGHLQHGISWPKVAKRARPHRGTTAHALTLTATSPSTGSGSSASHGAVTTRQPLERPPGPAGFNSKRGPALPIRGGFDQTQLDVVTPEGEKDAFGYAISPSRVQPPLSRKKKGGAKHASGNKPTAPRHQTGQASKATPQHNPDPTISLPSPSRRHAGGASVPVLNPAGSVATNRTNTSTSQYRANTVLPQTDHSNQHLICMYVEIHTALHKAPAPPQAQGRHRDRYREGHSGRGGGGGTSAHHGPAVSAADAPAHASGEDIDDSTSIRFPDVPEREIMSDPAVDPVRCIAYWVHSEDVGEFGGVLCLHPNAPPHPVPSPHGSAPPPSTGPSSASASASASAFHPAPRHHSNHSFATPTVHSFSSEAAMLTSFAMDVVRRADPDILCCFDALGTLGYLLERSGVVGVPLHALLSRLVVPMNPGASGVDGMSVNNIGGQASSTHASSSRPPTTSGFGPRLTGPGSLLKLETSKWGSSHSGIPAIPGRMVLNAWRVLKQEIKLPNYSLEHCVYHILHQRMPKYTHPVMEALWAEDAETFRVGLPQHHPPQPLQPGQPVAAAASDLVNRHPPMSGIHPIPTNRVAHHTFARAQLVGTIFKTLDTFPRWSEFARIYGISFFSVLSRGSQYRVESMLLRIARTQGYILPSPSRTEVMQQRAPEALPLILEPESGFYSSPVVVLDFRSLYPSVVIGHNLCYSTCIGRVQPLQEQYAMWMQGVSTSPDYPSADGETDHHGVDHGDGDGQPSTDGPMSTPAPRMPSTATGPAAPISTPGDVTPTPPIPAVGSSAPPQISLTLGSLVVSYPIPQLVELARNDQLWVSATGAVFLKPSARRGVLPRLLHEILSTRVSVKHQLKRAKAAARAVRNQPVAAGNSKATADAGTSQAFPTSPTTSQQLMTPRPHIRRPGQGNESEDSSSDDSGSSISSASDDDSEGSANDGEAAWGGPALLSHALGGKRRAGAPSQRAPRHVMTDVPDNPAELMELASLVNAQDARQMGLKMIANVTYGYTSAGFSGRMPCVDLADAIVQTGREALEKAIRMAESTEKWGARVIYGDTDSLFVLLEGKSPSEAFAIGKDIAASVTSTFPAPIKLQFEKVYTRTVLCAKKRYVGWKLEREGQTEPEFDAKGIETVRRDQCPATAKILHQAIRTLFLSKDLSAVKAYVQRQLLKIMGGRVPLMDFVFWKGVKIGRYSSRGLPPPAAVVASKAMLRDPHYFPRDKERIPYVVACGPPKARLVDCVFSPQDFVSRQLRLHTVYYITKQILPALDRVFGLVGANVRSWYHELPVSLRMPPQLRQPDGPNAGAVSHHVHPTIDRFYASKKCVACGAVSTVHQPSGSAGQRLERTRSANTANVPNGLCVRCFATPISRQAAALHIVRRMQRLEARTIKAQARCRACTAQLQVERRVPVREGLGLRNGAGSSEPVSSQFPFSATLCASLDCPWFFEARSARTAWVSAASLAELLDALAV